MQLINLTAHPINLIAPDGTTILNQAPDGPMVRGTELRQKAETVTVAGHSITVAAVGFGAVTDLPAPHKDVLYVVSRAAAEAVPDRDDVVYPDLLVRDPFGRVVGCSGLARVARPA